MFGTAQKRRQQQELQELTGMVAALGTPALRGSMLVATAGILLAGVGAILLT